MNIIFPIKKEPIKIDQERMTYLDGFYAGRFQSEKYGYQPYFPEVFKKLTGHCAYKYEGLSRKGLALIGGVGNGKTTAVKIIGKMFNIDLHHAIDIAKYYKDYESFPEPNFIKTERCKWWNDLIIDDMGTEKTVINYGERTEVLMDFIQERYRAFKEKKAVTYITSNLSKEMFVKRYSERVWSRIEEMCLIVDMTDCRDLRKEL